MRLKSIAMALLLMAGSAPAFAGCYEGIGCTDTNLFPKSTLRTYSCQALWELRNSMYWENGYCFQTARAIKFFNNNKGCSISNASKVPLNATEQSNIASIKAVETAKGCN